ncbi:hypothetical protein P3S68_015302 [Capsicum galapagoense]
MAFYAPYFSFLVFLLLPPNKVLCTFYTLDPENIERNRRRRTIKEVGKENENQLLIGNKATEKSQCNKKWDIRMQRV